jgi:DeoR/GlpR family transcriptional regulator of sugar metabolism
MARRWESKGKLNLRKNAIIRMLSVNDFLKFDELVKKLNVSDATIRRTLVKLEEEGKIIRTHGGARLFYPRQSIYQFNKKSSINVEQKIAIGKAAAKIIKSNEVIFLDSGTTVLRVAEAAALRIKSEQLNDLTVITNSIMVAEVLGDLCKVILLGGQIRLYRKDVFGPLVEKNIKMFRARKAFIGADGLTLEEGLMTTDEYTSKIDEEMINGSKQIILVADSTKFNRLSFVSYAHLKDIDICITDKDIDEQVKNEYEAKGVKIVVAETSI